MTNTMITTVSNSSAALSCSAAAFMRERPQAVTVGQTLPPGCVAGTVTLPSAGRGHDNRNRRVQHGHRRRHLSRRFRQRHRRRQLRHYLAHFPRQHHSRWPPPGHAAHPHRPDRDQLQLKIGTGIESFDGPKIDHLHGLPRRPGIPDRAQPARCLQLQHAGRDRPDQSGRVAILPRRSRKWTPMAI